MKDVCFNCGASEGLHHHETRQCPKNGIEETRYDKLEGKFYPQKWEDTVFEEREERKLKDAAPQLLEALKETRSKLMDKFGLFGGGHDLNDIFDYMNKAIENAEGGV